MRRKKIIVEDPPLTPDELLALRLVGGRLNPEVSHALDQRKYHDPANFVSTQTLRER